MPWRRVLSMLWRRVLSMPWKRVVSANTMRAQDCVRATLSSVSIHFLVALKSHHPLSWRREHADGRPRSFPLSLRHVYASRLVETCLCLALGGDVSMPRAWCASTISVSSQY
ncbi:hypothetical protein NDU88_002786 [Pleurodeles waltl]|uniref:Secreted protein n=1 Tax=Pleurodeles waltl TaxID=8319 RepID=A0AAV7W0B8_PLEWA|nr:hypothetical protein NDU88_002786 [Pleurodeles waltl]